MFNERVDVPTSFKSDGMMGSPLKVVFIFRVYDPLREIFYDIIDGPSRVEFDGNIPSRVGGPLRVMIE